MTSFHGIAVGVPARDEADRVDATLSSLVAAAPRTMPVVIVVAADACSDATAEIARRRFRAAPPNVLGEVVELHARCAGTARQRACATADELLARRVVHPGRRWIATTDADSTVPRDWFEVHERWARRGADAVAGLVRVDRREPLLLAVRRELDLELASATDGHHHVYGANLGVRADWWARVGGFPPRSHREDVGLVRRLRAAGARVVHGADSVVLTSGRLDARAPHGFGATLAARTAAAATRT